MCLISVLSFFTTIAMTSNLVKQLSYLGFFAIKTRAVFANFCCLPKEILVNACSKSDDLVLTSTKISTSPCVATISTSPYAEWKFLQIIANPFEINNLAAQDSPYTANSILFRLFMRIKKMLDL